MALATVVEVDSNIMQPINSRVYGHDEPNTPFSEMNKSIHLFLHTTTKSVLSYYGFAHC
jgi:hypothetical protein